MSCIPEFNRKFDTTDNQERGLHGRGIQKMERWQISGIRILRALLNMFHGLKLSRDTNSARRACLVMLPQISGRLRKI